MQVAKCDSNLGDHESALFFWESPYLHEVAEELSTLNEVHEEKDATCILEDIVHGDNERMIDVVKDFLLELKRLHRFIFKYHVFSNALHRVNLLGLHMLTLKHFSECSFADYTDQAEVFQSCFSHSFLFEYNFRRLLGYTPFHFILLLVWVFLLCVASLIVFGCVVLLVSKGFSLLEVEAFNCFFFVGFFEFVLISEPKL